MNNIKDQLSWTEFELQSNKASRPIKKISEFNRLIAHSDNFFLISGYGAFTDGYMLIISKDFIPSYGLVEKNKINEITFLVDLIKQFIKKMYKRNTVVFEHGMCACIGGLDRAHLHIMSISEKTTNKQIKEAINEVLYNRKAGIEHIEYNNYKLENIHDINQIYESQIKEKNNQNIKIVGKILNLKDIQNLSVKEWPHNTLDHINKGGHYVYFNSGHEGSSFLTTKNFQTQFGREVVFQLEKKLNIKFQKQVEKIKKKNPSIEVWRWQNQMFEKKIVSTINDARKEFKILKKDYKEECSMFNFKII